MKKNMECLCCLREFEGFIGDECPYCSADCFNVRDISEDEKKENKRLNLLDKIVSIPPKFPIRIIATYKTWKCKSCKHHTYCYKKLSLKDVTKGCLYYEKKEK